MLKWHALEGRREAVAWAWEQWQGWLRGWRHFRHRCGGDGLEWRPHFQPKASPKGGALWQDWSVHGLRFL